MQQMDGLIVTVVSKMSFINEDRGVWLSGG